MCSFWAIVDVLSVVTSGVLAGNGLSGGVEANWLVFLVAAGFDGVRPTPTLPTNVPVNKPVFIQQSLEQLPCQYAGADFW